MSQFSTTWTETVKLLVGRRYGIIAVITLIGIATHLVLRFGTTTDARVQLWPLWLVLAIGGIPLTIELAGKLVRGQFGADTPAGISIVAAVLLEEYLAGAFVVLMLSGGEWLESYAVRSASKALEALRDACLR